MDTVSENGHWLFRITGDIHSVWIKYRIPGIVLSRTYKSAKH